MKLVKPAVYSGPMDWGWVRIDDLAEVIGQSIEDVLVRFFWLTKDADKGVLPVVDRAGKFSNASIEPSECWDELAPAQVEWVPAGWASDVLKAHQRGAVEVRPVRYCTPEGCEDPEGMITTSPTTDAEWWIASVGYRANGTVVDKESGH